MFKSNYRIVSLLCALAVMVSCGSPTATETTPPLIGGGSVSTPSGGLVIGPPTREANESNSTSSESEEPMPEAGEQSLTIILPENIVGIEKTPTGLPVYRLALNPEDWAKLMTTDPAVLGNTEFDCIFTTGEVTLNAKVGLRGTASRYHTKKGLKVKFQSGAYFGGRTELNLIANQPDPTFMLEPFYYDTMTMVGALASFARKVELRVNGQYYGLMTDVESVSSRRFLASHGLDYSQGEIYRTASFFDFSAQPSRADYEAQFVQITHKAVPNLDPPIEFLQKINRTPPDQFAAWLSTQMDMPTYINYLVGNALIETDYIQHSRSYLIYEPGKQLWWFVPWDLNNSVLTSWELSWGAQEVVQPAFSEFTPVPFTLYEFAYRPLSYEDVPRWGVLPTRVLQTPEFRAMFITRLREVLNTVFTPEKMSAYIDNLYAQIEPSALADPWANAELVKGAPQWLKNYVVARREYLLSRIPALEALGQRDLYINEVGVSPSFIELYNPGALPYDLSGYTMSSNLHKPTQYTFPSGTVIPAGGYLVVEQVAVSADGGEVGLFKPTTLEQGLAGDSGTIDFLYYGPLAPGTSYGRSPSGSETWAAQNTPTPGR